MEDDEYSDVHSSTVDGDEPAMSVERSEIYKLIVTEEISRMLNRPMPDLEAIVRKIEDEMGVGRVSVLLAVPESVRIRYGIPARLNMWLTALSQSTMMSANQTSPDFNMLLSVDALNHGLQPNDIVTLVDHIIGERRITSLYALQQLAQGDINSLKASGLSPAIEYYIDHHLLKLKTTAGAGRVSLQRLMRLLAGSLDGDAVTARSESDFYGSTRHKMASPRPSHLASVERDSTPAWISRASAILAERYDVRYVEQLHTSMMVADLRQIVLNEQLPYGVFLLLRRFCRDANVGGAEDTKPPELANVLPLVYEEPTTEELITRVGLVYGHQSNEVRQIVAVLVEQNWLTQLVHLRSLSPKYMLQLNLPPKFVEDLLAGLYNPEILGMNLVDTSPVSLDERITVRAAVDRLFEEIVELRPKLETFQAYIRLFQHLILTPADASKRLVRKENPVFKRSAVYKAGPGLLKAVGYIEYNDCFLLPILYLERMRYAHGLLASDCSGKSRAQQEGSVALCREDGSTLPSELTRYVSTAWEGLKEQFSAVVGRAGSS